MPAADFAHVGTWIFDLDNTLYAADTDLFEQIDARMTQWLGRQFALSPADARAMQKRYYAEHGTTLAGLMSVHGLPPGPFLDYVHDIDLSVLSPHPELRAALEALPGRRLVFPNGSTRHAERVLGALGLDGVFADCFDIEATGWLPKPQPAAFARLVEAHAFDPRAAAMFEDLARNLVPAHALGMRTVLVRSGKDWSHEPEDARPATHGGAVPAHVHHVTDDLTGFLRALRP